MRRVPWWGVVSAFAAPVLLIGGWTLAAAIQPMPFNAVVRTISELAALDTPHRLLMTAALVGVGLSHLVTASALSPAATAGRLVLGLGGLATLGVAAFPLPAGGGTSAAHTTSAAVAFVALAVWPGFAWVRRAASDRPAAAVLSLRVCATASAVLLMAVGWFFAELLMGGDKVGLAERVAAGGQALWPLVVVLSLRQNQQT